MVFGHQEVAAQLSSGLPPVSLLLGPDSVGKTTLAIEACEHAGATGVMLRRFTQLHTSDARDIVAFTSRRSLAPKAIVACLDGVGDDAANALLKVLEEPPSRTYFALTASQPPLLTILSRAQVFRCGYLTEAEVVEVLLSKYHMRPDRAAKAARSAAGQVSRALETARYEDIKGPVLSALHATAEGDEEQFANAVSGKREIEVAGQRQRVDAFGEPQWRLLRRWAQEALTGRWRSFTPAESFGLQTDPRVADRVLHMTGIRPKLAVRLALLPFVWERKKRVR